MSRHVPTSVGPVEIVQKFRATEPKAFAELWTSFFVRIVDRDFQIEDLALLFNPDDARENQHAPLQQRASTGGMWNSMFGLFSKPQRNNQPGLQKNTAGNFIIRIAF